MNLIVVLRAVQDPAGLMVNRRAQKVFVNRASYRLNPSDHNALEAALAAAGDTHTVTAVAYGGPPAEVVLRDALAMGAARAIWVRESALQNTEAAALTGVLRCLADFVGGADVLVFGADVLDADLAQVAPRLAAALEGAFVGPVHQLEIGADTVQAIVASGDGYRRAEAPWPVVVAVARDSNRPRYAPADRIITAHSTPEAVEVVTLADLGAGELTPLTEGRGETFPPEREMGVVMEGTEAETAARVAEALRGLRQKPTA